LTAVLDHSAWSTFAPSGMLTSIRRRRRHFHRLRRRQTHQRPRRLHFRPPRQPLHHQPTFRPVLVDEPQSLDVRNADRRRRLRGRGVDRIRRAELPQFRWHQGCRVVRLWRRNRPITGGTDRGRPTSAYREPRRRLGARPGWLHSLVTGPRLDSPQSSPCRSGCGQAVDARRWEEFVGSK
jgi:hypothetical protein